MTYSITATKLIEIHDDIIKDFGGARGIRDQATLDHIIYRASRTTKLTRRAAIVLLGIAADHPFVDGNKRTGFVAAENILEYQGFHLDISDEEMTGFMLEVASYQHTIDTVEQWIKENLDFA